MKRLAVLMGLTMLATAASGESPIAPLTTPGPRNLPDWSGAWIIPEREFGEAVLREQIPGNPGAPDLLPAAAKVAAAQARRLATGKDPEGMSAPRTNGELCLPPGMPDVMRYPVAVEFLFSPGRVTLLSEEGPTIRRIYTDGRRPSDDAEPSYLGESIGHWERDTLVVETRAIAAKAKLLLAVNTSGRAHVTERIRLRDPTHLQIDTVVDDPGVLRSPWRYTRIYERIAPQFIEYVCLDNNRDSGGGEPDLTPPAEIGRSR